MLKQQYVIKLAEMMAQDKWYRPKELEKLWNVPSVKRKAIIAYMRSHDMLSSQGRTSQINYQIRLPEQWLFNVDVTDRVIIASTGNGVIDAKLRKEAGLPKTPTALESFINAAAKLGEENESMKRVMREITASIDKVRDYL